MAKRSPKLRPVSNPTDDAPAAPEAETGAAPPEASPERPEKKSQAPEAGGVVSLTCDAHELARAVQRVRGACAQKTTLGYLTGVLLRSEMAPEGEEEGRVVVAATDMELRLTATVPAKVRRAGSVLVSARVLGDALRALPREPVELQGSKDFKLDLRCGRARYRIEGMDPESFPAPAGDLPGLGAPLDAGALRELLDRTTYAMGEDPERFNLMGLHLERFQEGYGLRAVTTDGHRLAIADWPWEDHARLDLLQSLGARGVLVPRKAILEMRRVLDGGADAAARLSFSGRVVRLERGGEQLISLLTEGQFPDYRQILPPPPTTTAIVGRAEFIATLKRAQVIGGKGQFGIRMKIIPGSILLGGKSIGLGDFEGELDAEVEGKVADLGLNLQYGIAAAEALAGERLTLRVLTNMDPIRFEDPDAPGAFGLLMPMKLG